MFAQESVMDIQNDKDFAALPEVAKLYQACKERDLTIAEREYLKGARDAWQSDKAQAVPEGFGDIQSWIAVNSFSALDASIVDFPVVDANELAEFIDSLNIDVAVPEGFVLVKKELPEQIAEKMAIDRIDKPRHENDPVWREIAEQSYKDQVKSKKWEFWRDYKAMIEAQEPAND